MVVSLPICYCSINLFDYFQIFFSVTYKMETYAFIFFCHWFPVFFLYYDQPRFLSMFIIIGDLFNILFYLVFFLVQLNSNTHSSL